MEFAILIFLLFAVLFLAADFKNVYHLLFAGMLLGIVLSLAASLILTAKGSNYTFSSDYSYFNSSSIRYTLYSVLGDLFHISWNRVIICRNLGLSIFFICLILFVRSFYKSTFRQKRTSGKRINLPVLLMIAYSVLYFIFYHPDTAYHIYIFYHSVKLSDPSRAGAFSAFIRIVNGLFTLGGIWYLLYPVYYLFSKGVKNKISFFSEQLIGLGASLGLFNVMVLNTFFFHSLKLSVDKVFSAGYWGICLTGQLSFSYNVILPLTAFVFLSMIFYFTLMFGIDHMLGGWRERAIRRNLNKMYLNLRDVFHTDKNLFFSIQKLSERSIERYGTEEGLEALRRIKEISDAQMDTLTKNLNNIKSLNMKNASTDLIEILEAAIRETEGMERMKVVREYPRARVFCFLDSYHLMHVFTNILYNAVDAIEKKGEADGCIRICITLSSDWIFCSITDNGCGIEKKKLRRLVSLSQEGSVGPNHWGMGIPYIYQVIHAHGGHIKFRSKPNAFTAVDILLPQTYPGREENFRGGGKRTAG